MGIYYVLGLHVSQILKQLQEIIKNSNLIEIIAKTFYTKVYVYVSDSLLFNFDKIWPETI